MSLKAFHIIFIVASIVLALGFGAWALKGYFDGGLREYIWYGTGSLGLAVGLIIYLRAVIRKLKDATYL